MNKKVRLNASETEWIRPFTTVEEALENCKFRLNEATEFSPESRFEWEDEDNYKRKLRLTVTIKLELNSIRFPFKEKKGSESSKPGNCLYSSESR